MAVRAAPFMTVGLLLAAKTVYAAAETQAVIPQLNVPIPGLAFSGESGPLLAQYIAAAYRYLISISAVAATIMFVFGAFLYLLGSAIPQIQQGKRYMTDAVIGLLLVLGANLVLRTLNPELLNLKTLEIQTIIGIEMKDMKGTYGFKDADASAVTDAAAESSAKGAAGKGLFISPAETGEGVSIEGFNPTGKTAPERMSAYCTKSEDEAKLTTYDEKIAALVRAVLGWKKECVDKKGCAYVRGGNTYLSGDFKIHPGANDTPWLLNHFKNHGKKPAWSADCQKEWDEKVGTSNPNKTFYPNRKKPEFARFEFGEGGKKGGECWQALQDQYAEEFIRVLNDGGIFGTDCGGFVAALYGCAKGKTFSSISNIIHAYGKDPNLYIVYQAKNMDDFNQQLAARGGLRFGDVFIIGSGNRQHNFMFTGGREDVPFDWIEMGSWPGDGQKSGGGTNPCAAVTYPGTGCQTGVTIVPRGQNSTFWSDGFPIYVARPYEYRSCQSREDCGAGEACLCTAKDGKDPNKCSLKNVCHKAKTGVYCGNDEMCPKGSACNKNFCN